MPKPYPPLNSGTPERDQLSRRLWNLVLLLDDPRTCACRVTLHHLVNCLDDIIEADECVVEWLTPEETQWVRGAQYLCVEWLQDLAVGQPYAE